MYPVKIYTYFIFEVQEEIFECRMPMFWLKIPCSFHYNRGVPVHIRGTFTTSFYCRSGAGGKAGKAWLQNGYFTDFKRRIAGRKMAGRSCG
jgi:hypothetical protein